MKQSTITVTLTTIAPVLVLLWTRVPVSNGKSIHKREASCEHESFYCDSEDSTVFHRCLDGMYYTFSCPTGLHFSVKSQACDWPETADCSWDGDHTYYDEDYSDSSSDSSSGGDSDSSDNSAGHDSGGWSDHESGESSSHSRDADDMSGTSSLHDWSNYLVDGQPSSWISQAAASGKSWWRPSGVKAVQIKDVAKIKTPAHVVHIPDDKDDEKSGGGNSNSKKSSPKKSSKKSNESVTKSGGVSSKKKRKGASKTKKTSWSPSAPEPARSSLSEVSWKEGECNPSTCQPPSCFCAGTSAPDGISRSSTPQMVMITFDDEVSPSNYGFYQRLFRPGRYNPNGCPVKGCLFVSGSGTVYDLVYPLYAMGMEIASHTVSHRFPHTWWSSASYGEYVEEAVGQKNNLVSNSGIPAEHIKGFRVPFLQLGSDQMYSALYDNKFTYESSMFTGSQFEDGDDPAWPFTLDYLPGNKYCQHGSCPKKQYPGMWEIPVQRWYGLDGHSCSMADGCTSTGDDEETLEYLKSNFRRYYNSNRAPLGVFVHARWFETEHNLDGLDKFIDYLLTLDDVYIVSPSQVIEWMRKPTPMSSIHNFQPWSCEGGADDVSWSKK